MRYFLMASILVLGSSIATANAMAMPGRGESFKQYIAPGKMFRLEMPAHWNVALHENQPNVIDFRPMQQTHRLFLTIRRMRVPVGAVSAQIALNIKEQRLSKLPMWEEQGMRKVIIAGRPAMVITGTYKYMGNIQYPVVVEEVIIALGSEAFILHFECFAPVVGNYAKILEHFYTSFIPRPRSEQMKKPKKKSLINKNWYK